MRSAWWQIRVCWRSTSLFSLFNLVHTRQDRLRVWAHAKHSSVSQLLGANTILHQQLKWGKGLAPTRECFGTHKSLTNSVCWLVTSYPAPQSKAAYTSHNPLVTAGNCRLLPSCIRQDVFAFQDGSCHAEQYQMSLSQQLRSAASNEGVKHPSADRGRHFFSWSINCWLVPLSTMIHYLGWKNILAVAFYFLPQYSKPFPPTLNFWSESVQPMFYQKRGKLKTKFWRAAKAWCAFAASTYLHWLRSAWKTINVSTYPALHTLPALLLAELTFSGPSPWRCTSSPPTAQAECPWIFLASGHPFLDLHSLIRYKQQDSKQEIILCSFISFCNHLSSWVKINP